MTRRLAGLALAASLLSMAGCGAVRLEPQTKLPAPLIEKVPETVAIYYPAEFRDYVHKEERYQVKYEVLLGPAHVANLRRLLQAMFARVEEVDDPAQARAADPEVRLVLEPRFEDYAFLTPKDMAGDSYTVTIRYRLNLYNPQGERVDGYVFTGFGRARAGMMAGTDALKVATERAMRDAGAKLAVELTSQESVRRLLSGEEVGPLPDESEQAREALGSFGPQGGAAPAESAPPAAAPPVAGSGLPPPPAQDGLNEAASPPTAHDGPPEAAPPPPPVPPPGPGGDHEPESPEAGGGR